MSPQRLAVFSVIRVQVVRDTFNRAVWLLCLAEAGRKPRSAFPVTQSNDAALGYFSVRAAGSGIGPQSWLCASVADTFIQKTKKLYLDTRTQRNISKLNEDIAEVHQIMTRNIAEVLGHGERLDRALPSLSHWPLTEALTSLACPSLCTRCPACPLSMRVTCSQFISKQSQCTTHYALCCTFTVLYQNAP